ncbi:MAG: hypothetical protein ACYTF6_10255 [Planctomycetota bacterium]|jgi:hypothetical protein
MKVNGLILAGCLGLSLIALPALATLTEAPGQPTVTVNPGTSVVFSWAPPPTEQPVKYSVDVEGTVSYSYTDPGTGMPVDGETTVEASFGTSDYNPEDMDATEMTVPWADFIGAIVDALADQGVPVAGLIEFELDATAKVKGLDPGKDKGNQKNPWSPDSLPFTVTYTAP